MNGTKSFVLSVAAVSAIYAQTTACQSDGWQLLGAVNDVNVTTELSDSTKIATVWSYNSDTDKWRLYVPDQYNFDYSTYNLEELSTVKAGKGYWVNCLSSTDTNTTENNTTDSNTTYEPVFTYGDDLTASFDVANNGEFFIVEDDEYELEIGHITGLNTLSATYKEYEFEENAWVDQNITETLSVSPDSSTNVQITMDNVIEDFEVIKAQKVAAIDGEDVTELGLKEAQVKITVTEHFGEVYETTDWWDGNYRYNSQEVTDLDTLREMFLTYETWTEVGENTQVMLKGENTYVTSGIVEKAQWNGEYYDGCTEGDCKMYESTGEEIGTWYYDGTYIVIDAPTYGEAAFKAENGTIWATDREAVGTRITEIWYYGPSLEQMKNLLKDTP